MAVVVPLLTRSHADQRILRLILVLSGKSWTFGCRSSLTSKFNSLQHVDTLIASTFTVDKNTEFRVGLCGEFRARFSCCSSLPSKFISPRRLRIASKLCWKNENTDRSMDSTSSVVITYSKFNSLQHVSRHVHCEFFDLHVDIALEE